MVIAVGVTLMALIMTFASSSAAAQELQAGDGSAVRVVGLRCEFGVNPAGVDVEQPRLFWQIHSQQRGQRQTAWQVLAASSAELLSQDRGDLWDSGRVESDQTTHIRYAGAKLQSSQQVFWKVRAWDRDGRPSPWSQPATWTMGLLEPRQWKGIWIVAPAVSEALLLRREFDVNPGLRRAVVHVCGLGQYELHFNGAKVGQDLLSPGWTNYDKTLLYDTHDVTAMLHPGRNAVGIVLGNGMYHVQRRNRFAKFTGSFGPLKAILHLRLEYQDGTVQFVGTDETWRTHPGPIVYNSIYGGEDHDARLDPAGWDMPGFDDRNWRHAVAQVRPGGTLRGYTASADPIRAIETRQPISVKTFPDGSAVYDFGQNASFMPRLRVSGPAGSSIRLTPAEITFPDGRINRFTMGNPSRGLSWWQYTKSTDGEESWFPRFYYVGSRYVRAEFIPPGREDPPRQGEA
ncbi:MAG TPA: family 78 glycoside hydrolase catalytic domain, partial [Tepidisphaeraceae bacterium]|nr:family 78 glycoside hydrolase catalytic domain [Tepidisphaeraceae bacterium]